MAQLKDAAFVEDTTLGDTHNFDLSAVDCESGDYVIIQWGSIQGPFSSGNAPNTPTGYTSVSGGGGAPGRLNTRMWQKTATGNLGTLTVTKTGSNDDTVEAVLVVVFNEVPVKATDALANVLSTSITNPFTNSWSPATANETWCLLFGDIRDIGADSVLTAPTNYTEAAQGVMSVEAATGEGYLRMAVFQDYVGSVASASPGGMGGQDTTVVSPVITASRLSNTVLVNLAETAPPVEPPTISTFFLDAHDRRASAGELPYQIDSSMDEDDLWP